jgi:hypothetical protein
MIPILARRKHPGYSCIPYRWTAPKSDPPSLQTTMSALYLRGFADYTTMRVATTPTVGARSSRYKSTRLYFALCWGIFWRHSNDTKTRICEKSLPQPSATGYSNPFHDKKGKFRHATARVGLVTATAIMDSRSSLALSHSMHRYHRLPSCKKSLWRLVAAFFMQLDHRFFGRVEVRKIES